MNVEGKKMLWKPHLVRVHVDQHNRVESEHLISNPKHVRLSLTKWKCIASMCLYTKYEENQSKSIEFEVKAERLLLSLCARINTTIFIDAASSIRYSIGEVFVLSSAIKLWAWHFFIRLLFINFNFINMICKWIQMETTIGGSLIFSHSNMY